MKTLKLLPRINSIHIYEFLRSLADSEGLHPIEVDFEDLISASPPALAALVATIKRWKIRGRRVEIRGVESCRIAGYLQRMDVLKTLGVAIPEDFARRQSRGRFIPLQEIDDVNGLATEVAHCLAPGGDDYENPASELFDLLHYVFTEAGNNVRQHSLGTGFAISQTTKLTDGLVRIGIADNGVGILETFKAAGIDWAERADDAFAITQALKPEISSKGGPVNAGVGLTLVSEMTRALGGWFAVVSGNAVGFVSPSSEDGIAVNIMPNQAAFRGTILALAFKSELVSDWAKILTSAKIRSGLLPVDFCGGRFSQ